MNPALVGSFQIDPAQLAIIVKAITDVGASLVGIGLALIFAVTWKG